MTLLSVVKDVCAVVGVTQPVSVTTGINANRTMQEMLALATEIAQRIAYDTRDWTRFRKTNVFTGDGVATAFNLPADYKRMLLTANVWRSSSALQPMRFVPDPDEWLNRRALKWSDPFGEWTMIGGQMLVWPALAGPITGPPAVPAVTAYFAYLQKNCIALQSGGFGDRFTDDNDSFVLDERLLKLGMVWQWKANKGTSYAEDMGTYTDALAVAMGHDQPAPTLMGRRPMRAGLRTAYPFPVPT